MGLLVCDLMSESTPWRAALSGRDFGRGGLWDRVLALGADGGRRNLVQGCSVVPVPWALLKALLCTVIGENVGSYLGA